MSIIDKASYKERFPPLIKYNAQSSPYNQAMQNNYINNIGVRIESSTPNIEDTSDFVKNAISNDARHINPYLITLNCENNMTDN